MRVLLVLAAAVLLAITAGGVKWWRGKPIDGAVHAHLTLGRACSEPSSASAYCQQLESRPFQIVLNDGRGSTPILTGDAHGDGMILLPPGDYQIGFSMGGDMGGLTNHGGGLIHVASGRVTNLGTVRPVASAITAAGSWPSVTRP